MVLQMMMFPAVILAIEDDSDRAFMEQLYREHSKRMYIIALRYLHNHHDAQDAVNDAIVKLVEKIPLLRTKNGCKVKAYVVRTIENTSINAITKKQRNRSVGVEQNVLESFEDDTVSVDETVMLNVSHDELKVTLELLSQRDRNLLKWKYFYDWADDHVANALGIEVNSVRSALTRARKNLLVLMKEQKNDKQ